MYCKGQWWLRGEKLSRAIHFEHMPLKDELKNYLKKNMKKHQKDECWDGGGWSTVPVIDLGLSPKKYMGYQVDCGGLQNV